DYYCHVYDSSTNVLF
nr:immunoglobulin light chain junction region [Macaca mulatta]MOV66044.1 immunoglobulin light chain junction region [Macaca mulatta]MOV66078.1 immunoglobulin light chain junction region [Macaca mulatta]MOV66142.1 immunoglobulin light chain junction region [Macaca mulatta]MOV66347.1 immunoglobulin light chain junction region [Macaca mulatta]